MDNQTQVLSVGYYVPAQIVTNDELAANLDTSDEWIQARIGIKERRIAAADEVSSDLAAKASSAALENAGIKAEEIDMIILATNFPDHISPATAIQLQKKISALNAFAFDIRAGGCPGLVYGLSIASKYIADGTCNKVLVATVDLNSRVIDWEERLTAVIFGDGASAMVLGVSDDPKNTIFNTKLHTDPSGYYGAYIPAGGMMEPITCEGLKNKRQYLKMDGKAIYSFATTVFPDAVKEIVSDNNINLEDIDFVVPHQANINIIRDSMKKLNLSMDKVYCNLDKYGNTGGSSVGIALAEAIQKGLIKRGDLIVLIAYGAGLCWGTALIRY